MERELRYHGHSARGVRMGKGERDCNSVYYIATQFKIGIVIMHSTVIRTSALPTPTITTTTTPPLQLQYYYHITFIPCWVYYD